MSASGESANPAGTLPPPLPSDSAATPQRLLWNLVAMFAGLLPAVASAWAAWSVFRVFQLMAASGSAGVATVAAGLYQANGPLIIAGAIATLLASLICIFALRGPTRAASCPGLPLSFLVTGASCFPALLLWRAESFTLDVVAGRVRTAVVDAVSHLSTLVMTSFFLGLALATLVVVTTLVAALRFRTPSPGSPRVRAAVWAVNTLLLAALALSFYARSAALYDAALRGSL